MGIGTMVLLAFGLAMDAFAVSVANGIGVRGRVWKLALGCGGAFAVFQMLMPLAGYLAGHSFLGLVSRWDHWVASLLLGLIGGRMAVSALFGGEDGPQGLRRFSMHLLVMQAVATSIDALAVGVGLGVMQVNLALCLALIGGITFLCCFAGVYLGRRFGARYARRAELAGGVVLLLIAARILFEHLRG